MKGRLTVDPTRDQQSSPEELMQISLIQPSEHLKVPQPFLMFDCKGAVDDITSSKMSHVMFLAGRGTITDVD